MSTSDSELSEKDNTSVSISLDLIYSNKIFNKLYEIGFNGNRITKNFATKVMIDETTNSLKKYAANSQIPMKAFGPLILGLIRVYNKKLLIVLEEALNIFKQKAENQNNYISKIEKEKKEKGKKNSIVNTQSNLKWFTNSSSNNIFSLMNESLHHMINTIDSKSKEINRIMTPSKTNSYSFGINSKEIFQRGIFTPSEKISDNFSIIKGKENIFRISNMRENNVSNISDKNNLNFEEINNEINYDINDDFVNNNINKDLNNIINENLNSENEVVDLSNILEQNKDTSKEINKQLQIKKKKIILVHSNKFLEKDNIITIDLKSDEDKFNINIDNIINKFKEKLYENIFDKDKILSFEGEKKYEYLIPDNYVINQNLNDETINIDKINEKSKIKSKEKISEKKEEEELEKRHDITPIISTIKKKLSVSNLQNETISLLKNLSRLSLSKDDFNGVLLTTKIKEEKEKKKEKNKNELPLLNDLNDEDLNLNYDNDNIDDSINKSKDISISKKYMNEDEKEKKNIKELNKVLNEKIFNKKKSSDFNNIYKYVNKEKFPPGKLFYDLLILAQNEEIEITQSELFNNSTIKISK